MKTGRIFLTRSSIQIGVPPESVSTGYLTGECRTGEITDEAGGPCITCKFHNSKFNLETGKAVQWTTGVMGVENAFIGNIMGKVRAHARVCEELGCPNIG